jgi:hypothetical protein
MVTGSGCWGVPAEKGQYTAQAAQQPLLGFMIPDEAEGTQDEATQSHGPTYARHGNHRDTHTRLKYPRVDQ